LFNQSLTYDRLTIETKLLAGLHLVKLMNTYSAQSADFSVISYSQEAAFPPGVILEIRMYLEKGKQQFLFVFSLIRQSKRRLIGAA